MSKLGQAKDISTSSNPTYGWRTWDPEREKNLQPLSELMVVLEPQTHVPLLVSLSLTVTLLFLWDPTCPEWN